MISTVLDTGGIMALSTLANVKAYLGIPTGTVTDDALITSFLNSAISFVHTNTDIVFEPVTLTRYYGLDCVHGKVLYLGEFIQSVTTLTNGDGIEITSSDYYLMPKNQRAYSEIHLKSTALGFTFPNGHEDFISVLGSFGLFSVVPDDIVQVVNRLTAYLYRQKDNHSDLDRAVSTGNVTILPGSIPQDITHTLKNYRSIQ